MSGVSAKAMSNLSQSAVSSLISERGNLASSDGSAVCNAFKFV